MTLRLAILSLVAISVFGQQAIPNPLIGIVERASGRELSVRAGNHVLTFSIDSSSSVWKLRTFHDLSALADHEEVRVEWKDVNGKLVAASIATASRISGVVDRLEQNGMMVRNMRTGVMKQVALTPHTVFGARRDALEIGEEVDVAGWDMGEGRIEARRVAIYNGGSPIREPSR